MAISSGDRLDQFAEHHHSTTVEAIAQCPAERSQQRRDELTREEQRGNRERLAGGVYDVDDQRDQTQRITESRNAPGCP